MGIERRPLKPKEKEPDRREAMKGLAAAVGALTAFGVGRWAYEEFQSQKGEIEVYPGRKIEVPPNTRIVSDFEDAERPYQMNALAGKPSGELAGFYVNATEKRIPKFTSISFPKQLYRMWERKAKNNNKTKVETLELGVGLMTEYQTLRDANAFERTNFKEFAGSLNTLGAELTAALVQEEQREGLAKEYRLSPGDVQALLHLLSEMDGEMLAAYSMTEIMPYGGAQAKDNILLYDFLLRNAGAEFVTRIPSIFDSITSFGPFQFTRFALAPGVGAAKLNHILPEEFRVPEHVEKLVTLKDHSRAAILYALHNLASSINKIKNGGGGDTEVEKIAGMDRKNFTELVAAFHNRPATATDALSIWARNPALSFHEACRAVPDNDTKHSEDVARYAERSGVNYQAIQASKG